MKKITKIVLVAVATVAQIQSVNAQTPGFDDDVQDVPVNQGILILAILGVAYVSHVVKKIQKG